MAKKKYLRKSEFRYYNRKEYLDKNGNPHPAYITVRNGHKYKFNVITHSKNFFGKPTEQLDKNPEINSKYKGKKESRVSISRWDNDNQFSDKLPKNNWHLTKNDKKKIKKMNKRQK